MEKPCDYPEAIKVRLEYSKAKGTGGCIIWHLGEDEVASGKHPQAEFLRGGGK